MSETNAQPGASAVAEDLRFLLLQSVGRQIVAEFWLGGEPVRRCGTLAAVGLDYLLLSDEANHQRIAGELSALRLITILDGEAGDAAREEAAAEPIEPGGVVHTMARPRTQAAFNYAKRKSRKLVE